MINFQVDFLPRRTHFAVWFWLLITFALVCGCQSTGIEKPPSSAFAANDAQMIIGLNLDIHPRLIELTKEFLGWWFVLVLLFFLFVLPGWALLDLMLDNWSSIHWVEKLGLSAGLSASIYPILFLWTDTVGMHFGSVIAWFPSLVGLTSLTWRHKNDLAREFQFFRRTHISKFKPGRIFSSISPFELSLFIVLGLIFACRFWVIRYVDLPMWGDGYQHTLITQLLADHGGLFQNWLPYAELDSFTYHFGFHSLAAVFYWVSGMDAAQSVLWTGQILNSLAVIALFPLAMRVSKDRWGALITILAAGLLFQIPMIYTNWGRYTQLAGLVILPTAICLAWTILETPSYPKRTITLSAITFSGLALTHYRVLMMALVFFPAILCITALLPLKQARQSFSTIFYKIFWIGSGAFAIYFPWLARAFSGNLPALFTAQLVAPVGTDVDLASINFLLILPLAAWLSLPLIIAWGMWRRERGMAIILLWWSLLFVLVNPHWFDLPGAGIIKNFTYFIAFYIPAGLTIGIGIGWVIDALQARAIPPLNENKNRRNPRFSFGLVLITILIGIWGARLRLADIQPSEYALATSSDIEASIWIDEYLPQDSRFLVNSFLAFNGEAAVGSDGGWWLPYAAHRLTTQPPLNYVSEQGIQPDFYNLTNELVKMIEQHGVNHPDVIKMLQERNVTHVYIGQKNGNVNSGGKHLDIEQLLNNIHFKLIYHQDQVWIFEFNP